MKQLIRVFGVSFFLLQASSSFAFEKVDQEKKSLPSGEVLKEEKTKDLKSKPIVVPKKRWPFYFGGSWGLSYQVTDLDRTLDDRLLQLVVHPYIFEAFFGYKLWFMRFETSFIYRPMKKYRPRYEAEDEGRQFLILDYGVEVSTHALQIKLLFDLWSFKRHFNPYFGFGVAFAGTNLKSWSETERREADNASRVVDGRVTSSIALLGVVGNSFPLTDHVDIQLQYQFTFLHDMKTADVPKKQDLSGDELNKLKALPLEGLIISNDFLLGARYSL